MRIRGKLLVVSDWIVTCSLNSYSKIAPICKREAIVELIPTCNRYCNLDKFTNEKTNNFFRRDYDYNKLLNQCLSKVSLALRETNPLFLGSFASRFKGNTDEKINCHKNYRKAFVC